VQIKTLIKRCSESPLELYLAQGISRGEKMDYTIQKAVELGIKKIYPLLTERCNVKLDEERREKRLQHWRSVIISACEQSGRNQLPQIQAPQTLEQFLENSDADFKFVLAPLAEKKLAQIPIQKNSRVILMIGPEGGLSEREIQLAEQKHFLALNLGPRVLRTETAAVAAITALQCFFGDMSS
jgi:16S rRNA (uracil1498-N3)-methyltransferase